MDEEWVVNYLDENYDDKLFFFATKEEAENKFKEAKSNKRYSYQKLMTRSEYDEWEIDLMDLMDIIDPAEDDDNERD